MSNPVVLFGGSPLAVDLANLNSRCNGFRVLDFTDYIDIQSYERNSQVVGIWTFLQPKITREVITKFPNLKFVATSTTGLSHIDLDAVSEHRIKLLSLRDNKELIQGITSTPELTWMLVMAVWRRVLHNLIDEDFDSIDEVRYSAMSEQLAGKTIGILGFGRIGKRIAKYAEAFELKVLFSDPFVNQAEFNVETAAKNTDKNSLLSDSDIIVISASVTDSKKLIGRREVALIKQGAILINTARGSLWDETAITEALVEGKISGIGVDVYQFEELSDTAPSHSSPLLFLDPEEFNIIRTAHIGGACKDSINQVIELTLKQISAEFQSR